MELDLSFVKHSRGQGLSLSLPSTLNQLHMLLTLAGAGPETELSSQCGPEQEPDVVSPLTVTSLHIFDWDLACWQFPRNC